MNHIPVLLDEVLKTVGAEYVPPLQNHSLENKTIVDCTFGAGGYSRAFLEHGANVSAFDRDPSVVPIADALTREFPGKFQFINKPFSELGKIPLRFSEGVDCGEPQRAARRGSDYFNCALCTPPPTTPSSLSLGHPFAPKGGKGEFSAIVFDLGISSMQIDTPERGFSFRYDAPLDMRMTLPRPLCGHPFAKAKGTLTAAELIENSTATELTRILRDYGDVKKASAIARAMKEKLPQTTFQLRDLIFNPKDIAPVFQALRIAVNDELGEIETALAAVPALLTPGGICAVVTFHSLEDRLVKNKFREWTTAAGDPRLPAPNTCMGGTCSAPTKFRLLKTFAPTDAELAANPRARSAHLRAVEKL